MKETTNIADFLSVVALLEEAGIKYWIDGGWGVDLLAGQQTREHRDIDIDFDATRTEELLDILVAKSYHISTDCRPVRIELYSHDHGYLDIHPFVINEDGSAKQASPEGIGTSSMLTSLQRSTSWERPSLQYFFESSKNLSFFL